MANFLIIFREPDGRIDDHTEEEIKIHRKNWANWMDKWQHNIECGNSLTLEGRIIKGDGSEVMEGIHYVGTEIVGGYLLLQAQNLNEAAQIMISCPIYEFGGYSEVREIRNQ